jgi:hypothetical protein
VLNLSDPRIQKCGSLITQRWESWRRTWRRWDAVCEMCAAQRRDRLPILSSAVPVTTCPIRQLSRAIPPMRFKIWLRITSVRLGLASLVTFISFKKLQQKLDQKAPEAKSWHGLHLPGDRSVLLSVYTTSEGATIGDGSIVSFAARLMKLRPGEHERCNCDQTEKDMVDMHLVLISSSDREDALECKSVTAEISPHVRPNQWNADTLLSANDHPLRFTGQLMYDAAHRPCSGSPPARASGG